MSARQRSASSLSQNAANSHTPSPGRFTSSGPHPAMGVQRQDTDPLILSAAEIPSFHGDLGGSSSFPNESYPAMAATYIPSGLPPTMSRPRAHTNSNGSTTDAGASTPNNPGANLQPRAIPQGRLGPVPMHAGMRHASASILDSSARLGTSAGSASSGGNGFYGHHQNSSTVSIPPPPSAPPPQRETSNLPGLALSQREYQPHYVARPDYRSFSSAAAYTPHGGLKTPTLAPPPSQGQYQPQAYYNQAKTADMYRHPAPSNDSLVSNFTRTDTSEGDTSTTITSTTSTAQRPATSGAPWSGHPMASLNNSNPAGSSTLSITPDAAALWTLERVLGYLERHQFAMEWQQAFKNLDIHGSEFLELADNSGLFTYILPEVMRINPQLNESDEASTARYMKGLIRQVLKLANSVEDPDVHPAHRAQRNTAKRSSTLPANYEKNGNPVPDHSFGPNRGNSDTALQQQQQSRKPAPGRNELSKNMLGAVDNIRHSPSNSQSSPQHSPHLMAGSSRHGHTPSTDSIASNNPNHRPGDGKGDKKALIMLGLAPRHEKPDSPHERHPSRSDSFPERHGGGKILEKVRKKFWPHREGGETEDDSPTSPGWNRMLPPMLPFAIENNESSSSVDRASTSSMDNTRRPRGQAHFGVKNKPIYVFVTRDGRVWHLVDLTNVDTVDSVRMEICDSFNISDWESTLIHLTEVGQGINDDVLSDQRLWDICQKRADNLATLKFFIRPSTASAIDNSSRSSVADATSPVKRDNLEPPPPLFDTRPLAIGHSASDSQVSALKSSDFEQTKKTIENYSATGRTSPPMDRAFPKNEELDDLVQRLAVLRGQQDSGNGQLQINVFQPYSPHPLQPPSTANPLGPQSMTSSPLVERLPDQSTFAREATWDSKERTGASTSEDTSRKSQVFFDRPLPGMGPDDDDNRSPELHHIEDNSPLHKPEPLEEQQPVMLKHPTPPRKRVSRPPDIDSGFMKMPTNRPKRVVDFDNPRPSPYEDRKMEDLIPQRKAPPAPLNRVPSVSMSAVQKAQQQSWPQEQRAAAGLYRKNSISQKPMMQVRERQHMGGRPAQPFDPSQGIRSALVSAGQQFSSIAHPGPGARKPVPTSTPQQGATPGQGTNKSSATGPMGLKLQIPLVASAQKAQNALSPSDLGAVINAQTGGTTAKQRQQLHEAEESEGGEDDSDGDDGLFAIPIAGRKVTSSSAPTTTKEKTDSESNKGEDQKRPSVHFQTPSTSSTDNTSAYPPQSPPSPEFEAGDDLHGLNSPGVHNSSNPTSAAPHAHSPVDYNRVGSGLDRRGSFMRTDAWAARPPPESLIDHLDEFFPNLDLDQPILDDARISPPPSPSSTTVERPYSYQLRDPPLPSPVVEDPMESPVITMAKSTVPSSIPPPPIPQEAPSQRSSVAQRNVGKSGLGRMKSIREVARGAHESRKRFTQNSTTSTSSGPGEGTMTQQQQNMMRRKSTKLFGAKLIEVTPVKGRRGMMMQRQAQQAPPMPNQHQGGNQGGVQRQATFKWFKGELIGKGTYGRVYLGMNATTGEFLAVKQVEVSRTSGDSERQKEMIAALNQEIDTMQHLDHINIVQYLGCEMKEYSMSIFLEYISGGSIGSCLRKHGRFTEPIVRNLTRQILSGLMYLHSEGILHRDLKADNILLDVDGTCKISDFGISKKSNNIYGDDPGNSMQGSVFWMAPEVIRPEGQGYSAKIDIWSLGCVVLEMFAGRRPWSKEEAIGAIYKLGSERQAPPVPDDVSSVISPSAIGFLADCHTIDPSDRPTAKTLLEEHDFCKPDPTFNFLDTELGKALDLYQKNPRGNF